ncbi:adhesion G-protein coupled receptor G2 [Morone saxatilis]|uniref:adhesion G-protein coupled receptor G2 n=1 Tax=Morone saxatilis TaxID=34816 RepID=UPI0015E24C6A|nr:adhesion G-protein coupled receptor G2 [Morone saxatilis]
MPLLFQMTVCVDIRVVVPGAWVAFSYSSVHAPRPELGLEGDDEALYGWLLRVRHRFPLRLSPTHWHRVCLRRDALHNSFSLEVNGIMVAERTVIAHAIPPSGSLWLGCSPRDRPPGATLGAVELYLFRMWPDLADHGFCEDGTVIGWNAQYWGLTSPKARQIDHNLPCDAYFWMSISVEANGGNKNEEDVKKLVSNAFGCQGDSKPAKPNLCQVVQLSHAISACKLQHAGVSALQQAGDEQIQARIIGEVERVGRDLCEGVVPSDGSFVRCTSTSSLDNICQGNKHLELTCSLIGPNSNPVPQQNTESCSVYLNTQYQRGLVVIIHSCGQFVVSRSMCQDIAKYYQGAHLECHGTQQRLYSCMVILEMSGPVSNCYLSKLLQELIDSNTGIGNEKPLTRMVVCGHPGLPVHTLLTSNLTWVGSDLLTSDVCKPDPTLLKCEANETLAVLLTDSCPLTTQQSITQPSTQTRTPEASPPFVTNTTGKTYTTAENTAALERTNATQGTAQPNTTTPLATINSTQSSTAQPVLQTSLQNKTVTLSNSITIQNTTSLTPTEGTQLQKTTTAHQNTPEVITLSSVNSTLQSTPAVHTDSTLNTITLSPNHTTVYNVTTDNNRYLHNATKRNLHNATATTSNTTISTFTASSNHTVVHNVTVSDNYTTESSLTAVTLSPNDTTQYNVTTAEAFSTSPNHTILSNVTTSNKSITTSPNHTVVYNATTATNNYTTATNNYTTDYNLTTVTPSPNDTTKYNLTTAEAIVHNGTITTVNATMSKFTPSPNYTMVNNASTTTNNYTASNNYTTEYNVTTVDNNSNTTRNKSISTITTSPNHTVVYNATTATNNYTTATNNYTTEYNITTVDNNSNTTFNKSISTNGTITTSKPSPNYTVVYNVTTVSKNDTTAINITTTTVSSNKTATDNVTTSSIRETSQITTAPYENMTMLTASTKNLTVDSMTPVVHNTSKPVAPPNNQTGNHTTVTVTQKITTTTNSTTAATGISPIINHNETAGINLNLSSTTISLTADFNRTTKGPGVNLTTTPAKVSLEHIATTPTPTATSTIHGPLSAQINLTTEKVSLTSSTTTLQTTIFASTTTTKPGTGTTSTNPAETTESQEAQEEQANELLDQTQDASQLNSSQVAQLVGQLEKLLDGPTVSQAVGQKAIEIISNLMEGDSLALSSSANKLIRTIDELGLKLVVTGDSEIISSNSLVLAVRTVDGNNFPTTSVNIFSPDNVELRTLSRSHYKRPNSALGSVFLPSSLTSGLSPWEQHQANRVQFTFYTTCALFQDAALNNQTIVSPVLGSSVANLSISNLSENIEFTIQNINPIHANNSASCVYWDSTLNDGGGGWSSAGCFLVNATPEDTTCSCNHLTSFAILLDLSREEITDRKQAQILTFITYIGCGISAVFLAVTLLTYLSFQKLLRDIPAKILVQLCMSLLLLNLVFLLDGWLALYPAIGLCISTAFFLHYFLLTSFTWAGLEALHMYLSVIQVFTPYLSRYMLKFSLMGWGIPLFVVIVVISVNKDNYGLVTYGKYTDGTSDDFCWLRNDIAFYVGVVAYFVLIFSLCLLVFIMVMVQLARIKKQNPQNQSPNRGVMTDVRSIAGLVILLGLTWGFALFAWGPLYLPFVYLFSIFNSLQGFLVFVFHCAVKENVRRQWRTYLCCGRLRLAENSEWSRTATQNTRNMSVGKGTTSAFHLTSRSSSMISDGTSSSGSVFADSGISDGSSSDVILNEIHRRNLSLQGEA